MNRLLLLFGLLLAPALGWAAQSPESLRGAAESYARRLAPAGSQVQADAVDTRLRLPDCAAPLAAAGNGSGNGTRWTVAVSCAAPQRWTVYVPVKLARQSRVAVATRNLPAGTLLSAADLQLETRDTAALAQGFVADLQGAVGQPLRRPVAAGAVLTPQTLGSSAAVKRGQLVTLIGVGGSFEVRAQGKVMADAQPGEAVKVENSSSRKIVQGRLRPDGAVEVPL
jgi:flagella basal body P-ring formation protein FlgA